jgi:Helix-turn-helix domain/Domain of unknown function (DUF4115)
MSKGSFGDILKRERELREVSLNELTVATRVPPRLLEALENEDWPKLPGGVFNRGFVRVIAQFLGLSEEKLLAEYDLAYGQYKGIAPPSPNNPIPSPSKWLVAAAALALLLVIAAAILGAVHGLRRFTAYRAAKALAAATQARSQPAALPKLVLGTSVAPNPSGLDLSISTSTRTRIRVLGDGKLLLDAEVAPGDTRHFSAGQQFEVTAANPAGVLLELNGQAMPALSATTASGTIVLSQKNLRQAHGGNSEP